MNSLAHIEVNVSNLDISEKFYLLILSKLGWTKMMHTEKVVGFAAPDKTHLFIVQTDEVYAAKGFHRKNAGLNHLAFRVDSAQTVDDFDAFLAENNIHRLYAELPKDYSDEYDMEEYYATFFEDPDRIKLEVVFMR